MKILAIEAGCAECHDSSFDEPLIEMREFESMEAAKAHYSIQRWLMSGYAPRHIDWLPHPQGGEHVVVSQGSVWLREIPSDEISEVD